jgi:hypothetical protein
MDTLKTSGTRTNCHFISGENIVFNAIWWFTLTDWLTYVLFIHIGMKCIFTDLDFHSKHKVINMIMAFKSVQQLETQFLIRILVNKIFIPIHFWQDNLTFFKSLFLNLLLFSAIRNENVPIFWQSENSFFWQTFIRIFIGKQDFHFDSFLITCKR